MTRPCTCWIGRVALHDGHCCLRDHYDPQTNQVTCGHDEAGMARHRRAVEALASAA